RVVVVMRRRPGDEAERLRDRSSDSVGSARSYIKRSHQVDRGRAGSVRRLRSPTAFTRAGGRAMDPACPQPRYTHVNHSFQPWERSRVRAETPGEWPELQRARVGLEPEVCQRLRDREGEPADANVKN